ncbi:MAG: beta-Ala-His dipeptidase [Candidatus Thorarchaeota archaeon]
MVLENLEPKIVWNLFENLIAKTPRPSKHEERIREAIKNYILDEGKTMGISFTISKDNIGNLLIKKPATPEMEHCPPILLQAHFDMICETDRPEGYDFLNNGIPLRIQVNNEWIDADGTTLGADNGIGLALALAILTDPTFTSHGPIEVLFTVNEEDGFDGATQLDPVALDVKSKLMINLDGGPLGEIVVGSVGGRRVRFSKKFDWKEPRDTEKLLFFELLIEGLLSGHSGEDIKLPRANANKIASSILSKLSDEIKLYISSWKGGTKGNVIPAKAEVIFAINPENKHKAEDIVSEEIQQAKSYYKNLEPKLKINFKSHIASKHLSNEDSKILLATIHIIPHGVLKMSPVYKGVVESSNNLAIVNTEISNEIIWIYPRSLIRNHLDSFCLAMNQLGELGDWRVFLRPVLPEWTPDPNSKFLKYVVTQYNSLVKEPVKTSVIHGGLETGMISTRLRGLEMVSLGPTMIALHSPSEKLKIFDVGVVYDLLKKILTNLNKDYASL